MLRGTRRVDRTETDNVCGLPRTRDRRSGRERGRRRRWRPATSGRRLPDPAGQWMDTPTFDDASLLPSYPVGRRTPQLNRGAWATPGRGGAAPPRPPDHHLPPPSKPESGAVAARRRRSIFYVWRPPLAHNMIPKARRR